MHLARLNQNCKAVFKKSIKNFRRSVSSLVFWIFLKRIELQNQNKKRLRENEVIDNFAVIVKKCWQLENCLKNLEIPLSLKILNLHQNIYWKNQTTMKDYIQKDPNKQKNILPQTLPPWHPLPYRF